MDSTTLRKVINSNRSGPHKPPIGKRVIHYLWAACVARFNHYWWLSLVLLDSSCQYFSNNISDVIIEVSTCLKGIVDFICNSKLCFYFLNILCVIVLIFLGAKLQKKNLSKAVFVSRKLVSRKPLSEKQTHPKRKILFWKPNQIFLWLESVFRWLESVFCWPESVFCWPTFLMANKHRKVWKIISRKLLFRKQTLP